MIKGLDKTKYSLWLAIAATTIVVFVADVKTPLGTAVWAFYFVPMVLSFFLMRPLAPSVIATFITALVIAGVLPQTARPIGSGCAGDYRIEPAVLRERGLGAG